MITVSTTVLEIYCKSLSRYSTGFTRELILHSGGKQASRLTKRLQRSHHREVQFRHTYCLAYSSLGNIFLSTLILRSLFRGNNRKNGVGANLTGFPAFTSLYVVAIKCIQSLWNAETNRGWLKTGAIRRLSKWIEHSWILVIGPKWSVSSESMVYQCLSHRPRCLYPRSTRQLDLEDTDWLEDEACRLAAFYNRCLVSTANPWNALTTVSIYVELEHFTSVLIDRLHQGQRPFPYCASDFLRSDSRPQPRTDTSCPLRQWCTASSSVI